MYKAINSCLIGIFVLFPQPESNTQHRERNHQNNKATKIIQNSFIYLLEYISIILFKTIFLFITITIIVLEYHNLSLIIHFKII